MNPDGDGPFGGNAQARFRPSGSIASLPVPVVPLPLRGICCFCHAADSRNFQGKRAAVWLCPHSLASAVLQPASMCTK